jgi:Fic family protein
MFKQPPFTINSKIIEYIQSIFLILGNINYNSFKVHSDIRLRKANNIKSVKSSLAIEGNSLSLEQVNEVLNGRKVIAPRKDIVELKNAISVYELFDTFEAFNMEDLLKAHQLMMKNLAEDAGDFRNTGVGIFKGRKIIHLAPSHKDVSGLIANLFAYLKESDDSLLIKSCIFHYEFEFIHPFSDGNGRMGRLWQQLILSKLHSIFKIVCIEELLEKFQIEYYDALHSSDQAGNSETFVEFMLSIILQSLEQVKSEIEISIPNNFKDRLYYAKNFIDNFKRAEYLALIPNISTSTASRDLINGVKNGILEKINSRNQTIYIFKKYN